MKTLIALVVFAMFSFSVYAEDVLRYSPNNNEYSYESKTAVETYNSFTNKYEWTEK